MLTHPRWMRTPRPLPAFEHPNSQYPLLSAADCTDAGLSPAAQRTAIADGRLIRLGRGILTPATELDEDPWRTLRIRTAAYLRTAPPGAIAAGWSAVALHRLPTMTTPPPTPSAIRLRFGIHGSDRTPWGHTRYCMVPDRCVSQVDGLSVLNPGFTACDLVRSSGILTSLMVADSVARTPLGREQIADAEHALRRWPRYPRSAWLARHCDGFAESPLETAGRYAAIRGGLPVPISNAWLGAGWPRARVDHWWPEQAVAGEGDGALKYEHDAASVIAAEKHRQWGLEVLGVTFVRYGWDLAVRRTLLLAGRFGAALAGASTPISADLRWWPCAEGWAIVRGEATVDQLPGRRVRRIPLADRELAS